MATRDLPTNSTRTDLILRRKMGVVMSQELERIYREAFASVTDRLRSLMTIDPESLTKAQRAAFVRQSGIAKAIAAEMGPGLVESTEFLKELSMASYDGAFFRKAWAVNQAAGVEMTWGAFSPEAVAVAVGLSDDFEALGGLMPKKELIRHKAIIDRALRNYDADAQRIISRTVTRGIIEGKGAAKIARELNRTMGQIHSSAMTIARTESMRSMSIGSQLAYDQAANQGVRVKQVWSATLDDRTRPDHAEMDGVAFDEEIGGFLAPWAVSQGPHRNGLPEQDINCRCTIIPEIEGYAPEKRRIRDEGLVPYQTYAEWAGKQGIQRNRYGQRFDFI